MARLIEVQRNADYKFQNRQLPLVVDDNLTFVIQFSDACATFNNNLLKNKDIAMFAQKYSMLNKDELISALTASNKELFNMLSQVVHCVGCRRSVERLYHQLVDCEHPAMEPLLIINGKLTLADRITEHPKRLGSFFHAHVPQLDSVINAIPKSKKNRRCVLHSLELQRVVNRSLGNWTEMWDLMAIDCRQEVVIVANDLLLETLESYLKKHRFCTECKSKVISAYKILVGELEPEEEKGYLPALYYGITNYKQKNFVQVLCDQQFLSHLISKAEPELKGRYNLCGQRERHAKTIEIAQEEVLTCLGIYLYERLHRVWQRHQEMEQIWQILFHAGVGAIKKNFELFIENKRGYSQLELLCEEFSQAEKAKELRKELKRQKKKRRKEIKAKLEQDEKENEEKESIQLKNSHSSCGQMRMNGKSLKQNFVDVIIAPSDGNVTNCSCDTKCDDSDMSCSNCGELQQTFKLNSSVSRNNHQHSSYQSTLNGGVNVFPECHQCSSTKIPYKYRNLLIGSDSGYFSSSGATSKCSSCDCLKCDTDFCHNSEISSIESNSHLNCDQSLDSVYNRRLYGHEICSKCSSVADVINYKEFCSSDNSQSLSIYEELENCRCSMCSCRKPCGKVSSLQDMLHDSFLFEEEEEMVIPDEVIHEYQAQQQQLNEKRHQLRKDLRLRFANFRSAKNLDSAF